MNAVLEAHEPSARYLIDPQSTMLRQFELLATAPEGVTRLRKLILSLAVRGKLFPEQAASALVEANSADLPCALPSDWQWIRLSDLGEFRGGKTPSTQRTDYWGGSIPWITPKDMKQLRLSDSQDHVTTKALEDGLALIPSGSLLVVVRSGILRRTVPTAINSVDTTINQDLKALVFANPELTPYVQLLVRGFEGFILDNLTKVGTTVESIQFDAFASQPFPLPPSAEQARIVARVDELMRLCDALEAKGRLEAEQHARLLSTLLGTLTDSTTPDELAANWQRVAEHFDLLLDRPEAVDTLEQTILQLAVRGLLVRQNIADLPAAVLIKQLNADAYREVSDQPYELPGYWAWARLGQVAEIASNLVSPTAHLSAWQVAPDCIEKGTGRLLHRRTVAEAGIKSANHRFASGQILYSKIRPSLSKAVLVDFDGLCSADMYPINSRIDPQFLLIYMLSQPFLAQVSVAENRVKMPKLNQEALNGFLVAVPPIAEQARIVARVDELRRLCAALRQRLIASQATQSRLADALIESALA